MLFSNHSLYKFAQTDLIISESKIIYLTDELESPLAPNILFLRTTNRQRGPEGLGPFRGEGRVPCPTGARLVTSASLPPASCFSPGCEETHIQLSSICPSVLCHVATGCPASDHDMMLPWGEASATCGHGAGRPDSPCPPVPGLPPSWGGCSRVIRHRHSLRSCWYSNRTVVTLGHQEALGGRPLGWPVGRTQAGGDATSGAGTSNSQGHLRFSSEGLQLIG